MIAKTTIVIHTHKALFSCKLKPRRYSALHNIAQHNTEDDAMEQVSCVAFKKGPGIISLPRPNRHGDIIKHMVEDLGYEDALDWQQGFLTSSSRFVNRIEAANIAIESGQIDKLHWLPNLFSEDLW